MSISKRYSGVTLVEGLLVIVIIASLLLFSIRQYQLFRTDSDVQQLNYNVDTIFDAMAKFYRVNCYGTVDRTDPNSPVKGKIVPGKLNPASPSFTTPTFLVNITTDLKNAKYLEITLPTSPLIDTSVGTNGYIAQFNYYTVPRNICTAGTSTTCTSTSQMATAIVWKAQVAVKIATSASSTPAQTTIKVNNFQKLLGADCTSNISGSTVTPCASSTGGSYLVWERTPSLAAPNTQSGLEIMMPVLQQFQQEYSTYPINYLLGTSPAGRIPGGGFQYILCAS